MKYIILLHRYLYLFSVSWISSAGTSVKYFCITINLNKLYEFSSILVLFGFFEGSNYYHFVEKVVRTICNINYFYTM